MRGGLERTARQEERGGHDVELPTGFTGQPQRLRHVGGFHEPEPERRPREPVRDLLEPEALRRIDPRRLRRLDGENDVLLMQHLVVLQTMHQRCRSKIRVAGEEHRGAGHALRRLLLQHRNQIAKRNLLLVRFLVE